MMGKVCDMEDRKLLEAAAKAAGLHYHGARVGLNYENCYVSKTGEVDDWFVWSPLTDDGEALRLAVQLGLSIEHTTGVEVWIVKPWPQTIKANEEYGVDALSATRRAIVRTAAAMAVVPKVKNDCPCTLDEYDDD